MSTQETDVQALRKTSAFASRMLSKQLDERMKQSGQQQKISPADAAKYAVPQTEEVKEKVTV